MNDLPKIEKFLKKKGRSSQGAWRVKGTCLLILGSDPKHDDAPLIARRKPVVWRISSIQERSALYKATSAWKARHGIDYNLVFKTRRDALALIAAISQTDPPPTA